MAAFTGKTDFAGGTQSDRAALNRQYHFPNHVGNVRFVYSGGSSAGPGWAPGSAYATMIQAQTAATANNGDAVYVLPGHAEDVAAAAAMTFSKAGVRWVGLGIGRNRPTLTWKTSTAAQVLVTGANVSFENFVFDFTGIDAVVAGILVSSADVAFRNCEFITNSATAGAVLGILTAATAARLVVENCRFIGPATNSGTTTTAQIQHEVGVDYVIKGNYFTGKMTQSILNATACLRGLIHDNVFVVATGTKAIAMDAASTPMITNNRINVPSGTAPIVAAAGFVCANAYSAAAGVTAGTASTF